MLNVRELEYFSHQFVKLRVNDVRNQHYQDCFMKPLSNAIYLLFAATLALAIPVNSIGGTFGAIQVNSPSLTHSSGIKGMTPSAGSGQRPEVAFEENRGQADRRIRFINRTGRVTTFLADDSIWFSLNGASTETTMPPRSAPRRDLRAVGPSRYADQVPGSKAVISNVKMRFEGSNGVGSIRGEKVKKGKVNYLRGRDRSKWITGVPTFGAVRYRNVYKGVDVVYYGTEKGELEYDFVVRPGGDPGRISLDISGAQKVSIDEASGDLVMATTAGELRHQRPIAFQEAAEGRALVPAEYKLSAGGKVSFKLGKYDKTRQLTIDPVVAFSTYLGGTGDIDFVNSLAIDQAGSIYMAGSTNSADFPTVGPFDPTFGGGQFQYDAFVTKMNAAGTAVIYSTYLGGNGDDNGLAIAVDQAGQAYVTGFTDSTNFPTTANTFKPAITGTAYDGFVTKLSADGASLVYSTYFGGGQNDGGYSIAVDSSGSAVVGGETSSPDFPLVTPFQGSYGGGASDAFIARFNPAGNALTYSTYLGGGGDDLGLGVAVDASGMFLAGGTTSTNFPLFNALQGAQGGGGFFDGFAVKLDPAGANLVFSTYLGGNDYDFISGLDLDPSGNMYVVGTTASGNFPVVNPFQNAISGPQDDAFVAKISGSGALVYSTYIGGSGTDAGTGIAVDASGSAFITGTTFSTDFPTGNHVQGTNGGQSDAFAAKIAPAGSSLIYSTYLGGSSFDDGIAVAIDPSGNAVYAGGAESANFPLVSAFQNTRRGASDAFILKIISSTTITGQVFGADGRALRLATVTLTDQNGIRRQVLTSSAGFYSFADVLTGSTYTLSVASKRYRFTPVNITPMAATLNVDFTGQE